MYTKCKTYNIYTFTGEMPVADYSAQLMHEVIHVITTTSTSRSTATSLQPAQYDFKYQSWCKTLNTVNAHVAVLQMTS